ncbi:hypothetical protein NXS19_000598 [Fusarium pseudograminearum]|nr:hypothetical protein NXS19_000598 [Fusarium pseudograminearum]
MGLCIDAERMTELRWRIIVFQLKIWVQQGVFAGQDQALQRMTRNELGINLLFLITAKKDQSEIETWTRLFDQHPRELRILGSCHPELSSSPFGTREACWLT